MSDWYKKSTKEILEELNSSQLGLSQKEAKLRLEKYGPNRLPEAKKDGYFLIFLRQFQSPLIYILFSASFIVLILNEVVDSLIIFAVLIFNAIVGTIQEGRAQNALLALKRLSETNAVVIREGREIIIPDTEITVGDIIFIKEGDIIPADARIIASNNLRVDEAMLTGESKPVYKFADVLRENNLPPADQKNTVFKGSRVVSGNGKAVVVAIGLETEIGKISKKVLTIDTEIPLKTDIRRLSKLIIIVVFFIAIVVFSAGVFAGNSAKEMFVMVVSLAVSVIPEGLPIVLTLILATGVWRMSKQNVLVKKLQAVEALGQAKVIAVDKTGTLTKNEMVIQKVYINGKVFEIGGIGYESKGDIRFEDNLVEPLNHPELLFAAKIAAFCGNAKVIFDRETETWQLTGDPTEAALLVFGEKVGFNKEKLEEEFPLVAEIPFDHLAKYHITVHKQKNHFILSVVGAPEEIITLSHKIWRDGKEQLLNKEEIEHLELILRNFLEDGFRVLAFASREFSGEFSLESNIGDLTFGGFFAMKDALRPEVKESVRQAQKAGIRVVMITGDHKITAQAIAKEAGIWREGDRIISGSEIDKLPEEELVLKLENTSVFARVTPDHKLKIIQAYRRRGEIIAMTGDGVNDAPSLVAADLGVAMGKIGTEVAKEAADLVLLDDNFGNIVSAIEEGRSIYKTIQKVILYLFSTSLGEVLTILGAFFSGYPLPILPSQIIWLNFVTDGFLDVALAMEPKEKNSLKENFRRQKYLIDKTMVLRIILMGTVMMIGTLYLLKQFYQQETDPRKIWTISLTTLAAFQWFNAWNCRSEKKSLFKMEIFENKFLVGATIIIIFLQLLAIYNPMMQKILRTTSLTFFDWIFIIIFASLIVLAEETRKYFHRKFFSKE